MATVAAPPGFRISLRELLVVFTAVIIGLIALRYANKAWQASVSFITLAAFIAATVIVMVDRGVRQAAALGFVAASGIYLGLVYGMRATGGSSGAPLASNAELDPQTGELPTTVALRPFFDAIRVEEYSNPLGETTRRPGAVSLPPGAGSGGYVTFAGESPSRGDFMRIGHCLWALLFGYAAGKFAVWVYVRRLREQHDLTAPTTHA